LVFSGCYDKLLTEKNVLLGARHANFEGLLHGDNLLSRGQMIEVTKHQMRRNELRI
jgi:hypothetical protein